jgi:hypothetical protein
MKAKQMQCPTHGLVLAVKNTHKLRNPVAVVVTFGIGAKVEGYMCPQCGGPVSKPGSSGSYIEREARKPGARISLFPSVRREAARLRQERKAKVVKADDAA